MSDRRTKFYRDKQNGRFLGVCAGVADYVGIDVTVVRVVTVLLTLAAGGWTIPAYFITAWLTPIKPTGLYNSSEDEKFWQGVRRSPTRSTREVRSRFRDIDRRLADVELYYTSRNTALAEEIERLR
jgi:phage shock protein C